MHGVDRYLCVQKPPQSPPARASMVLMTTGGVPIDETPVGMGSRQMADYDAAGALPGGDVCDALL